MLHENVQTDNLPLTVEIVTHGVDKAYIDPVTNTSILMAAKKAKQSLQQELLKSNGFDFSTLEAEIVLPGPSEAEEQDIPTTFYQVQHERPALILEKEVQRFANNVLMYVLDARATSSSAGCPIRTGKRGGACTTWAYSGNADADAGWNEIKQYRPYFTFCYFCRFVWVWDTAILKRIWTKSRLDRLPLKAWRVPR